MLNYDTTLVTALSTTGLKVYYELFCDSNVVKPCITYCETNDTQEETGDTLGYSKLQYTIKLWGEDLAVLNPHCVTIDSIMRGLGFKRISFNQLTADKQICKIMLYQGLGLEKFN